MRKAALALTLALTASAGSAAQAAAPPQSAAEQRTALLEQCPPITEMTEGAFASHPIHVDQWGSSGPRVLLVHGGVQGKLGGGPLTFEGQKPLAARGWRLVRVDRPGFGATATRGADDQEADSRWLAEMLDGGAILIGHSFGGADSLLAAGLRPEKVRALVLVEAGVPALLTADPNATITPEVRADLERRAAMLVTARDPGDYARRLAHSLEPSKTDGMAADLDRHPDQAKGMGCALLRSRQASPEALRRAAAAIKAAHVPVLVITGGWSPSVDAVGDAVAAATGGHHVIVRSPDHYVQLSNPTGFNAAVDAFLRGALGTKRRILT